VHSSLDDPLMWGDLGGQTLVRSNSSNPEGSFLVPEREKWTVLFNMK